MTADIDDSMRGSSYKSNLLNFRWIDVIRKQYLIDFQFKVYKEINLSMKVINNVKS